MRRRTERRDFGQGVFFLLGLMAAVALFMAAGWGYNRYYDAQSLAQNGIVVRATLAIHPDMAKNNCVYTFSFSGAPCTYYTHLPTQGDSVLLPYQLPARTGDVVLLRFDPTEIDNHTLDFEHITDTQLERLCERVRAEYATAYPNLGFQTTDCFVKTVYRLAGVYGLANIYQRNTPITQNWYHNQLTFALMQQRFDYKDEVTECR